MKKKKVLQIKSMVMLVVFLINTFYPTVSFAIADSPSQVDFESYEDFNSTDMVDLVTGDFTYNIPIVEVPSPEGGYQIPLTYHAGIELNEESTWVGLGWNLNPGVLTRQVSMYADDDLANDVSSTYSGASGNGYVKSFPFYTKYYDSEKGKGGAVNLLGVVDFGWGSEKHLGIAPIGLTIQGGKASYDFQYMINGDVALASLVLSFSSCGLSQAGVAAAQGGLTAYSVGSAIMAKNDASKKMNTTANGAFHQEFQTEKGLAGLWGKKVSYKWSISGNSTNSQYGSLYLGYMGQAYKAVVSSQFQNYALNNTITVGQATITGNQNNNARVFEEGGGANIPSSDMYMSYETYPDPGSQMTLSYDNYSVKGNGVSGSISPYRLEIGTVADGGTDLSARAHIGPKFTSDYKVPFNYLGDFSNSYVYQNVTNVGQALPPNIYNQDDLFLILNNGGNIYTCNNSPKTYVNYPSGGGYGTYSVSYNANVRMEGNRTGLTNKKLSHNKHIEWYSNSEITGGYALSEGFMDAFSGYSRSGRPTDGIGGFAVTNELGFTYHYALPVYNNYEKSYAENQGSTTNYSTVNNRAYATMWLLTGITGPDFVDRGTSGIVDDQDWGYWMKFEYGKFASDYTWRNPYSFLSVLDGFQSCKWGGKETYYLNRIASRTHSALFVKELKSDGKSFYESDGLDLWGNGYPQNPSSSLRLKDIYVLENSDYAKLLSSGGGGYSLTLTNSSGQNNDLVNGDTYNNVLDAYDITNAGAGTQNFLDANQQEKIHFNYDYKLCDGTYNSFDVISGVPPTYDAVTGFSNTAVLKGKTTLRSVEFFSKNNSKLSPSYEFYYGNENSTGTADDNPDYNPFKWDGYGKYKSGGSSMNGCHNAEKKADQWCLKDIVTPLGATISVEYDRDNYSNINGKACNLSSFPAYFTGALGTTSLVLDLNIVGSTTSYTDLFSISDAVKSFSINDIQSGPIRNVTGISGNTLVLNAGLPSGSIPHVNVSVSKKYGDGIRVKRITTSDENGNQYVTKYFYTKDNSESGPTSGVASYEPALERGFKDGDFYFYKRNEHPYSPVMYSNVTVVNGRYDNTFKETSKQTFHFVTPHEQMIDNPQATRQTDNDFGTSTFSEYWKYKTVDGTYVIGNLDTIKTYNQFNNLTSKTVFDYIQNDQGQYANYLGSYTEGLVLWESILISSFSIPVSMRQKIIQSYKITKPNILKSITTYKDRLVTKRNFLAYDYETGQPTVTEDIYGGQEIYRTEKVPAYKNNPSLGSKAVAITNKNMMAAPGETYSYVKINGQKELLGASVVTYTNNHGYRDYYGGIYSTFASNNSLNVWLPKSMYSYKAKVEENGTINNSDFVPFTYLSGSGQNAKWVKTGEATLYDHYSHALEIQDMNFKYSSVKYGYDNSMAVAGCDNAKFNTWCYSGAEDLSPTSNYYEGEVAGSNQQFYSTTYAHTGSYCSKLSAGQVGFAYGIYKSNLPATGKYRASVWVHQTGKYSAQLDCKSYLPNGTPVAFLGSSYFGIGYTNSNTNVEQAGNWWLLTVDIDLATLQSSPASYIVFLVRNNAPGGNPTIVYADDFRVHPTNSPIVSNVFDQKTKRLVATLDKENYATKYFYDDAGKLKSVYKESKLGFTKVTETKYQYSR